MNMKKIEVYKQLKEEGIVVVVRGNSIDQAMKTVEACYKGGINLIEVTFTVPHADEIISRLKETYKGTNMIVGAGTVLDPETARIAILAGADFIVSPCLNVNTIKMCNRYQIPVMCGIMTPTEAMTAMEYGVDILKLFPGDIAKPAGLKGIKGPFPYANIMPTGGVNLDNLEDWFKAGAYAVGAGSFVTKGANSDNYEEVEKVSRELVEKVKKILGDK